MKKIVKILGHVVLGATALIGLLFFLQDAPKLQSGLDAIVDMPQELKPVEIAKISQDWTAFIFNWAIILFVLSAAIAVLFAIGNFISKVIDQPKNAVKTAVSILLLVIVVLVAYSVSSDSIPTFLGSDNFDITPATSRMVETFLYTIYILFGITGLAMLYSEVSRVWK